MKKIMICLLITIICLGLVGCNSKKEEEIVGGYTVQADVQLDIDSEVLNSFNNAIKNGDNKDLKPVALLGTQVVAGTNYMFLCNEVKDNENNFKIAIVYKDLGGESKLTKVTDFDLNNYLSNNITNNQESLAGGFSVNQELTGKVSDEINSLFETLLTDQDGPVYKPLLVLGTQVVAGTNYAVLCLGIDNDNYSLNILTIYDGFEEDKLLSIANINLAELNN